MNKIVLDRDSIIIDKDDTYYLKVENNKKLIVKVLESTTCKIVIVGNSSYDIEYILENNSNVIVNSLNYNNSVNININLYDNTKLIYNHSVVNKENSLNTFNINNLGNNISCELNNNGINLSDKKLYFQIDGIISKLRKGIDCSQNSCIINYQNGNSKIIPNLIIDSNDIKASHSAYIGNFDKDIKFYIMSRGIKEKNMNLLLYKAILLGKMNLSSEQEEFKRIINEWW